MRIFTLFDGSTGVVGSVHQFAGNTFVHRLFTTQAGIVDEPANPQSGLAVSADFNRNLVVGTADAASFNFQRRHDVLHGSVENFHGVFARFGMDQIKCIIDNAFSDTFFAVEHNLVDESG